MLREVVYSIFDGFIVGVVAFVFIKIGVYQVLKGIDEKDRKRKEDD